MRQLKITKSITNRESQSLEKYLQEIGKVDLLTPEEEVELAKLIKATYKSQSAFCCFSGQTISESRTFIV